MADLQDLVGLQARCADAWHQVREAFRLEVHQHIDCGAQELMSSFDGMDKVRRSKLGLSNHGKL